MKRTNAQAPYEEISKAEYEALSTSATPITGVSFGEADITDELGECEGGHCPIK